MLIELRIRNFAVIEDLALELGPGLNVLTGETGAGKSIIVGALSLLLGERASSESIRVGADRALVEAVFDVSSLPELQSQLESLGFLTEGDLLLLRREVHAEGRTRAWINGSPATAAVVGEFGRALVDFHGQHEHQTLLKSPEQRRILDAFAGAGTLAADVARMHSTFQELESERTAFETRRRELQAKAEFLRLQLQELRDARLRPNEDVEVGEELRRLEHAEELGRDSEQVHQLLYAAEGSASEQVSRARDLLRRLVRFDPTLEGLSDQAESLYHQVAELGRSLGSYAERLELSPARTDELRRRADLHFRLKRKYGPELSDVLSTLDRLEKEVAELEGSELSMGELERRVRRAGEELRERARELSRIRAEAGDRLAGRVEALLPDLGMPEGRVRVELDPVEPPEAGGAERVRFLASLNPGFEPRPLSRVASGGELSRVMLALKSILAREDRVPTLVFDEIDAGIGGAIATAVARNLREVSNHHQVFVVTHLAQLASRGQQHLHVDKEGGDGVASTSVRVLEGDGRVREIARMLGGNPDSNASREHARELLAAM